MLVLGVGEINVRDGEQREPRVEALGSGHFRRRPIKRSLRRNDLQEEENLRIGCLRTQSRSFRKEGVVKSAKHFREVGTRFRICQLVGVCNPNESTW